MIRDGWRVGSRTERSDFSGVEARSLFSLALGDFDFHALSVAQPVLGPLFFFFFIAIIFVGMQTMFLTIICEAFTIVRGNIEYQKNDYEVVR